MGIGSEISDAVAVPDPQRLQGGRPAIRALEEHLVGKSLLFIDNCFATRIQTAGATRKI
jgi:hypothetical protein